MSLPTIRALPDAPSASDAPSVFNPKAFAFVQALKDQFVGDVNDFVAAINALEDLVKFSATSTTSNAITSDTKTFTIEAGKAFAPGMYVMAADATNHANFVVGAVDSYSGTSLQMTVGSSAGSTGGSGTHASWILTLAGAPGPTGATGAGPASVGRATRTSNTQLVAGDKASVILASSSFTQTFSAPAMLGANWWCIFANTGSGDITMGSVVSGASAWIMYPGEARLFQCDGTDITSVVLTPYYRPFTASGAYLKPPGYKLHGWQGWGAGGAGGKGDASNNGGGGGGGPYMRGIFADATLGSTGQSHTVSLAAGGSGVTSSSTGGGGAGPTTFGALLTFYGGGGGSGGSGAGAGGGGGGTNGAGQVVGGATGGTGGAPTTPTSAGAAHFGGGTGANNTGGAGQDSGFGGGGGGAGTSGAGGSSVYGGGGGGAGAPTPGAGGTSKFGGAGGAGGNSTSGVDGTAPGGGGGGTRTGTKSGDGARGEFHIWGIA